MSDIIQDAKRLLDGATPGPWEHYNDHGIVSLRSGDAAIATDLNAWDADLIAKSWTNAKALAEETWQYGVRYIGINHGEHHIEWVEPTEDAEVDKDILHRIVKRCEKWGQFPKVVRRRVSPVEVVND